MRKIIVKINPKDDTVSYEIDGVSGTSCTDLTDLLTRGDEVKEQSLKAEYNNPEQLPAWEGSGE
jgi:hypothetical protein